MDELARFALVTFTSVLFIVDPVAAVPTYLVITQQETPAERRRTALRACVAMTVLLALFAATGAAIALTGAISFVCLRLGEPLLGRLGKTGIRVVTRVMGLLLAAVAVRFVFSGVREAFAR
jgi:small neutral amino acid transporter SnatA (MarC family)